MLFLKGEAMNQLNQKGRSSMVSTKGLIFFILMVGFNILLGALLYHTGLLTAHLGMFCWATFCSIASGMVNLLYANMIEDNFQRQTSDLSKILTQHGWTSFKYKSLALNWLEVWKDIEGTILTLFAFIAFFSFRNPIFGGFSILSGAVIALFVSREIRHMIVENLEFKKRAKSYASHNFVPFNNAGLSVVVLRVLTYPCLWTLAGLTAWLMLSGIGFVEFLLVFFSILTTFSIYRSLGIRPRREKDLLNQLEAYSAQKDTSANG
jgi:hypothetical protein